jgi:hypothetical protein
MTHYKPLGEGEFGNLGIKELKFLICITTLCDSLRNLIYVASRETMIWNGHGRQNSLPDLDFRV